MSISNHEEKMINLQYQMRENQADLQHYLADLDSWESDIKQKEQKLMSAKSPGPETPVVMKEALPPVRNTIHKKKLKKKKKEQKVDPPKSQKLSGFDFQAWDKFDVDKALEEIDQEEKKETSSSEYETDEEWELERKKHLAGVEKDKGNKFFKAGDFDTAVEAYSKGIEYDATSAILPANRAMALLKQQKYGAAELDCTTSISLDPMYVKAYLRRANARVGLGKIVEAIEDFNRVLDIEPSNKMAKTEIERLQKEKERDEKEPPPLSTLTEGNQGIVKPIYKPPEERSKVPLRRIPIEEIGIEKPKPAQAPVDQSECSKKIKELENKKFDALLSSASTKAQPLFKEEAAATPLSSVKTFDKAPHVENPQSVDDAVKKSSLANVSNSVSKRANENFNGSQPGTVREKKSERNSLADNGNHYLEGNREFSIPQSSFQFQTDYKVLRNKPEEFFNYLMKIPPDQFPKLFGQFLEADILNRILKALLDFSDRVDVNTYKIICGLTAVNRFSMTAMFLSRKEKKVAGDLIQRLSDAGVCSESDLSTLKKKYDL